MADQSWQTDVNVEPLWIATLEARLVASVISVVTAEK
jgi:hypothetical protein